jgi:hypothetical protein
MCRFLVDPARPAMVYSLESMEGEFGPAADFIHTSTDGGEHWTAFVTGIDTSDFEFVRSVQTNPAAWKAFEFDPNKPQRLFVGGRRVYEWMASVGRWQPLGDRLVSPSSQTDFISAIGVVPSPGTDVYAATAEGGLFVNENGTTWTRVSGLPIPAPGFVSRIEVNPYHPSDLVAVAQEPTGAGRVWMSRDAGGTWQEGTGNLPSGPRATRWP